MIAPEAGLSVTRQCALLGIARSSFYCRPRPESAEELGPAVQSSAVSPGLAVATSDKESATSAAGWSIR